MNKRGDEVNGGVVGSLFGAAEETRDALVTDEQIEAHVDEPDVPLPRIRQHNGGWLRAEWTDETRPDRYSKNSDDPQAIAQCIAVMTPKDWRDAWCEHAQAMAMRTEGVVCQAWAKLAALLSQDVYQTAPRLTADEFNTVQQNLEKRDAYRAPTIETMDLTKRLELRETPDDAQRLEDNQALIKSLPDGYHKMPWDE